MTSEAPRFEILVADGQGIRSADDAVSHIKETLAQRTEWLSREGGPGTALTHLFGRLAELAFNRLNQVPEKHFLAFLNEAGIDLLPPRAAKSDVTFTPAPDVPLVRVPAGIQVATVKTEIQPEVIFETERDLVVAPNELKRCIAFDALSYSDRTANATGTAAGAFRAFAGESERERALYLGHTSLFTFADDAQRQSATIALVFELTERPLQAPPWQLVWGYYDEEKQDWVEDISPSRDTTLGLIRSGEIEFDSLPVIGEHAVANGSNEWTARWLRVRLTKLTDSEGLPHIDTIVVRKSVASAETSGLAPDGCFYHVTTSGVYIPLDPNKEFYPLGSRPGRHDTFYIAADSALSKPGAEVALTFDIAPSGLPDEELGEMFGDVELVWSYYDGRQWQELGKSVYEEPDLLGQPAGGLAFTDNTNVLTAEGADKTVTFKVPDGTEVDSLGEPPLSPPRPTVINEKEHYWLRVRLAAGFYGEKGEWVDASGTSPGYWKPERLYPPLVRSLTLSYTPPPTDSIELPMETCLGLTDFAYTDYSIASQTPAQTFAPFTPREDGPALYLGFEKAFPEDEWIQLLVDVESVQLLEKTAPVSWEYWSGEWRPLRVSDGSDSLRKRGYVGFFAPGAHIARDEFGYSAHWLRLRPYQNPVADGGKSRVEEGEVTEVTLTLDASGSTASPGESITRYIWERRRYNPEPLRIADAGEDIVVHTDAAEATVTLDASRSLLYDIDEKGKELTYRWDKQPAGPEREPGEPAESPWLKGIHINAVAVTNAETLREEVLGSSNDKPGQEFSLLRTPLLAGSKVYVRELDRPPGDELDILRAELTAQDPDAEPLLSSKVAAPGEGVWVRWHEVSDFHSSGPASRHFTLDPISGQLRFGDGVHGKIPPLGRDNIKVGLYRTHNGVDGNAATGSVTVLRNPSGDLANIDSVSNREAAAGGSAEESREQVEERGPQTLKHRNRAVTVEDFEWLALEAASSEIAMARCLPVRDRLGLQTPGWVTVVITPESAAIKPTPSPALLRVVRDYLRDRALVNLKDIDQVHVKGPEYVEVSVVVDVVPSELEKSDQTELEVLERLEDFLHPLRGGPQGDGWDLGRDVFRSEIYTEIEAVNGVDYSQNLRLQASLQQFYLQLGDEIDVPFDIPDGSQVSTFDERIKLVLGETLVASAEGVPGPASMGVFGFKVGDKAEIVADDGGMLASNLTIATITDKRINFESPFGRPDRWNGHGGLVSADGRVRLPLIPGGEQVGADKKISGVTVKVFQEGNEISIVPGGGRDPRLEFLALASVKPCRDRVFVPEGHLIYSGTHDVRMRLG
jgi:hypothetical protein